MWRLWTAALFWGLNWPVVRVLLDHMGPWTLRAVGLSAGAAVLLLVTRLTGQSLRVPRGDRGRLLVAGLLNVAGFNLCAVFAQLSMPTSRAAILTFTMPLWAALFAWLALGERLDRLRLLSLATGALGLGVLSVPFWPVIQAGGLPFGLVYVLGAAICWAAGTVWLKAKPVTTPPLTTTAWQVVVAAIVCTGGLALFETPRLDLSQPIVAAALAYHILLPQAASYVLWFTLIRSVPASTASLGTLLIPIFGVVGAVILLGDTPTPLDLLGLALILCAVALDQVLRPRLAGINAAAER
jgi:drug/metabolite transporter (DMT)-like permease